MACSATCGISQDSKNLAKGSNPSPEEMQRFSSVPNFEWKEDKNGIKKAILQILIHARSTLNAQRGGK